MREFFASLFFPSSDPALASAICDRAARLPAAVGRALMTDLAGRDAGEVESALDAVAVPVLAIQSTTMDTALKRVPFAPSRNSVWIDLFRTHVSDATVTILPRPGPFPQIELADEVSVLIAGFALDSPGV